MIKITNTKVTPFGGIYLIHKRLVSDGIIQFVDNELGNRCNGAQYNYSDIVLSRIYTAFIGGDATEDVNYIRENTLNHLPKISIPSADTILRADKELSTECEFIETQNSNENKINVNNKLNQFLICSAIKFKQLDPNDKYLVYDFDHQFIPAEKYDATYGYKNEKGYFPAVATISNIPVYIEGRNGNCNVKTAQLSTHKRVLSALKEQGIVPKIARMDSGSYIKEVTDFFHEEKINFFIRANSSETLLIKAADADNWEACTINYQNMEVTSFDYKFGSYTHRIIAYRFANKTGQISAFTKDAKNYLFIITDNYKISEKEAIIFYNQRGNSERVFDIQNNDFNWNSMPHSFLEENTVYLIIMAFAHIVYKYILGLFSKVVDGLNNTSRLKRFMFKVINIVAKFTRSGRRQIIQLATNNTALLNLVNSS